MKIPVVKHVIQPEWQGETVFIYGGGPSLRGQNLQPFLQGRKVLGINTAFKLGDWISACLFGDTDFYVDEKNRVPLKQFKNPIYTMSDTAYKIGKSVDHTMRYVAKDNRCIGMAPALNALCWHTSAGCYEMFDRLPDEEASIYRKLCHGTKSIPCGNTGAAGIDLACKLGASCIVLLGFDMYHSNGQFNWHDEHTRHPVDGKLILYSLRMAGIAYQLEQKDIKVVNTSMKSSIPWWKKQTLSEFLLTERRSK